MKYLIFCILLLLPAALYSQYSTEAMQAKKLSDQYDQRGYISGQPLTVDGNLTLSNANGVPSYIYPISSYTSNGHQMTVSLNYCGSASFTTFHRYYNTGLHDNWSKFSKSAPLWILNVNGFAVQTLSFASTFYNDPYAMKRNNPAITPPLDKYTDKQLVWTLEGYDFTNSMQFMQSYSENMQDVIRLLRGDGGVLELRNAISYDNLPVGLTKTYSNTALYTGDYYVHDVNSSGYARVMFDSAYIKPGASIAEPFRIPRILKYYPGDGLEYVFREFVLPFGKEPPTVQWTNGGNGVPAFGGYAASPKILYLEEINDGSYTIIKFDRARHLYEEQKNLHPDLSAVVCTPTRGRALCTGFTGHTLIYGSNSFVIEALGRTTTVKFNTAQFGSSFKENPANSSDMFEWAQKGADAAATSDQGNFPNPNHNSYVGLVTSITDPEQRVTQFEYEKYKRTLNGVGFPHDLNYSEELPVELVHWRMSKVSEATTTQILEYHGSTTMTVQAGAGELTSGDPLVQMQIKYALNSTAKALKKYDNDGVHLSSQNFSMNNRPVAILPDFLNLAEEWTSTDTLVDEVTKQRRWTDYHFHRFEFLSFKRGYQGNHFLPFTQQVATKEVAGEQTTHTQTHYAQIGRTMYQPLSTVTRVSHAGGALIPTRVESYEYDTTTVRLYPTSPGLKDTLGRELSERRVIVKNPANTNQIWWKEKTSFLHLPIKDTVFLLRERQWNKFAALAEYFRQDSIARLSGSSVQWEEVMGCIKAYDTTETSGRHTIPPLYNLNTRSVITDASNTILQGSARLYSTVFRQEDSTAVFRGALLADSIIGTNGVSTLGNRYTYWGGFDGFHKTLLRTRENTNGSITEFFYEYGCPGSLHSGVVKKNDNSTGLATLRGRTGAVDYESPLGQRQWVRSYGNSTLRTNELRQVYERTYYDQISASLDANGWYSRFSYDKNGRLQTAWLPYDFQGDSLYPAEWYGKLTVEMPGYTTYRRTFDTLYCDGLYKPGGAVNTIDYGRMLTAKPITLINGCGGSGLAAPPSDKREQTLLANKMVFEYNKWYRGYCSGATSQEIADAVKLDNAKLIMHVSKVFGSCVNFRVSVLEPKNILNRWGDNNFDTLLAKTFVLNCSGVITTLSTPSATGLVSGKRGQETVLGDVAGGDVPYKQLTLDLKDILDDLIHKNWVIEIDVLTPGAEVELVSDATDYQPRLEMEGNFKRVYELADYTLNYTHYDSGKKPIARSIIRTKLDDSLHTASSVGLGNAPMDNKRYTEKQVWFGADYRAAKSYEIIGDIFAPSPVMDSVVFSYTGFGATKKMSDQLGDTTSTVYDALGRPVKVYKDDGTFVQYSYATGNPPQLVGDNEQDFYGFCAVQITTQDNGIWPEYIKEYQYYDALGRLRREKSAYNRTTKYEYDLLGRLTTVVNPAGDTTRYWYDEYGRVKYKYQPDMGYLSYAYDKLGNTRFVQTQQQANSGQLSFTEYDDLNRPVLIGETDLDNNTGGGHGDPPPHGYGILTGEEHSGGTGVGTERSSLSPVAYPAGENTTVPAGKRERTMSFPAHPVLNLNRLTDQLDGLYLHDDGTSGILTANKTVWQTPQAVVPSFWSLSSLLETTCIPQPLTDAPAPPYLAHPAQQYNDPGLPLASVASFENIAHYPQNARIAIGYDELPASGGSVWTHFPARTQWDALTPTGRVRNLKGREAAVAYRQHAGEPYHFVVMSYDERGRLEALLRHTENLGFDAVYYTYNSMNAVTSIRVVDPQRQYTTWYGYNANGKVDSVWTKLSAIGTGLGLTTPAYRAAERRGRNADIVYTYTQRWQVDTMAYPLIATQVAYAYNGKMLMDSMVATRNNSVLFRQVLKYDSLDCITNQKWQDTGRNEVENTYVYNKHKWLETAFETSGRSQSYYYDAVGNRTNYTAYSEGSTYTYSDPVGHNRLTRTVRYAGTPINYFDTTNYSYNANGAVIGKVSRDGTRAITETMSYDNVQGLLKKYTRTEGAIVEDWRYRHNAAGEREQKRQYERQGETGSSTGADWTYYLLDASKRQLAVYEGKVTRWTTCNSTVEKVVYLSPIEYLAYGQTSIHNITTRPITPTTSMKEYKIQDHLGSTRVVIDENGTIIGQYDYFPFGDLKWSSAPEQRLSFIDKEKDIESGDYNLGVRQYNPKYGGRFGSIDPLWEKYRSLTPYQYAGNNPLIFTDPTGKVIQFAEGTSEEFKQGYNEAVNYLRQSETASKVIDYLENSEEVFVVQEGEIGGSTGGSGVITWNVQEGVTVIDNNGDPVQTYDSNGNLVRPAQSPAIGLIHEMGHVYHEAKEPEKFAQRQTNLLPNWTDHEEKKVIQTIESKVIQELNIKVGRKQEVERMNHKGKSYKTQGSTTTTPAQ